MKFCFDLPANMPYRLELALERAAKEYRLNARSQSGVLAEHLEREAAFIDGLVASLIAQRDAHCGAIVARFSEPPAVRKVVKLERSLRRGAGR